MVKGNSTGHSETRFEQAEELQKKETRTKLQQEAMDLLSERKKIPNDSDAQGEQAVKALPPVSIHGDDGGKVTKEHPGKRGLKSDAHRPREIDATPSPFIFTAPDNFSQALGASPKPLSTDLERAGANRR